MQKAILGNRAVTTKISDRIFAEELWQKYAAPIMRTLFSYKSLVAVQTMSTPNRQVIVLLLEDFSQQEIADILQLRDSTVRVRINRAKSELRDLLAPGFH